MPPCWVCFEIMTLGNLSNLFKNLDHTNQCKKDVTHFFGLKSPELLENWMHCISLIRNLCAHHSRLWNRNIAVDIKFPEKPSILFIQNKQRRPNKLYAPLCCILYLLNIIEPNNTFKAELIELLIKYSIDSIPMGFPPDWKQELFWKIDS
jgi:Abortive infection bacteriophage resistance protein